MHTVILHGGGRDDAAGTAIHALLEDAVRTQGWTAETKVLSELTVRPCSGCYSCWFRTPGECPCRDDGRQVLEAVVRCDVLAFLSPVTFGGYSSLLKLSAERLLPQLSPLFTWVDGEMHHRLRYPPAYRFLAIGWQRAADADGATAFAQLAARNAKNFHAPASGSLVLHAEQTADEQRTELARLVATVGALP